MDNLGQILALITLECKPGRIENFPMASQGMQGKMETKLHEMPQRLAVTPGEALFLAGYSESVTTGNKSATNLQSRRVFPFPIRHLNIGEQVKKVVLVKDIEAALRGEPPAAKLEEEVAPPLTRRGRPRKDAAGAGAGVKK
ncbi:MAG: hypothetical protein KGL33_07230 [Betaproteobacteria bacterium]|nr:hypothetical protein [Betaproteobacteria bacterium]